MNAIAFLKEFQKELQEQNTDGQASPRFWALRDYHFVSSNKNENYDRILLYIQSEATLYSLDDYINRQLNNTNLYSKEACRQLNQIKIDQDFDELANWVYTNTGDYYDLIYQKEEAFIVPSTMFLTKAEAQEHIKLNHYHYTNKVHTYAMTAWRAPKVEKLLDILENFTWDIL